MSDSHSYVPTAEVSSFNRNLDLIRAPLYSITSSDRLIPQCSRLNSAFGMKLIHDMVHERCDKRNPPTIMNRFSIIDDELGTYNSIRESFLRSETRVREQSLKDSYPGIQTPGWTFRKTLNCNWKDDVLRSCRDRLVRIHEEMIKKYTIEDARTIVCIAEETVDRENDDRTSKEVRDDSEWYQNFRCSAGRDLVKGENHNENYEPEDYDHPTLIACCRSIGEAVKYHQRFTVAEMQELVREVEGDTWPRCVLQRDHPASKAWLSIRNGRRADLPMPYALHFSPLRLCCKYQEMIHDHIARGRLTTGLSTESGTNRTRNFKKAWSV